MFDINSFLPILPIAYVKPGQGKTLVQNIIDDGYVQDTFYDVILVANYNRLYRGRFPKELQELPVVSLKEQNRKRERGGKEHDI